MAKYDLIKAHGPWIAVVILAFLAIERFQSYSDVDGGREPQLRAVPEFSLPIVSATGATGTSANLASYAGRPLVINFWASWCTVCRGEKELLRELDEVAKTRGAVLVGVATYDTMTDLMKSRLLEDIPYEILLDEQGDFALAMKVRGLPQTVLIDGAGRVRRVFQGPLDPADLEVLRTMLHELAQVAEVEGPTHPRSG